MQNRRNAVSASAETRHRGFTLAELVVVFLVLAILSAVLVPTFNKVKENSARVTLRRTAQAVADNANAMTDSAMRHATTDTDIEAAIVETPLVASYSWDAAENLMTFSPGSATVTVRIVIVDDRAVLEDAEPTPGTTSTTSTTTPATTTSTTSTTAPPAFTVAYSATSFSRLGSSEVLLPTVTGGSADSFALTGTLPTGVSFSTSTGAFTGSALWNFEATAISVGYTHACAIEATGDMYCWGNNANGQLGDGSTTTRTTPVKVSAGATKFASVSVGYFHTCAVTTAGGAKCWGRNSSGQLGDSTTTDRTTPANVSWLTSWVTKVSAGGEHSCAIDVNGAAYCWGEGSQGRLGYDSTTDTSTRVSVTGLSSGVTAIAAGGEHTCAIVSGAAKCWGSSDQGEVGDGGTLYRDTPQAVSGLSSGVTAITTGGEHSCAVVSGGAKCWGYNANGQLGDNSTTRRLTPVAVTDLATGVSRIDAGLDQTCAATTGGGAKCWGGNSSGQLGDGTGTRRLTPVDVNNNFTADVTDISAGHYFGCWSTSKGVVKCWGRNNTGQLGVGTTTDRSWPEPVNTFTGNAGFPRTLTVTASSGATSANTTFSLTLG